MFTYGEGGIVRKTRLLRMSPASHRGRRSLCQPSGEIFSLRLPTPTEFLRNFYARPGTITVVAACVFTNWRLP